MRNSGNQLKQQAGCLVHWSDLKGGVWFLLRLDWLQWSHRRTGSVGP